MAEETGFAPDDIRPERTLCRILGEIQAWVVPIDPTIAEIDVGGLGWRGDAFEQNGGLFQLLVEGVAILGIPREGTGTDD